MTSQSNLPNPYKVGIILNPSEPSGYGKLVSGGKNSTHSAVWLRRYIEALGCISSQSTPSAIEINLALVLRRERTDFLVPLFPELQDGYIALGRQGEANSDYEIAIRAYRKACSLAPNNLGQLLHLAILLKSKGDHQDCLMALRVFEACNPSCPEFHNYFGSLLYALGNFKAAAQCFSRSLIVTPNNALTHVNRGLALAAIRDTAAALADQERALAINPAICEAHLNRGFLLQGFGRANKASDAQLRAIEIDPYVAEAHANLGLSLAALGRDVESRRHQTLAITLMPELAEAYLNLANLLRDGENMSLALCMLERGVLINPNRKDGLSHLAFKKYQVCDWADSTSILQQLRKCIEHLGIPQAPFAALTFFDDPKLHQLTARLSAEEATIMPTKLQHFSGSKKRKIRIGYFSADFHDHATMHLAAEFFEYHDRGRFELIFLSFGPDKKDDWRHRAVSTCDQFINLRDRSLEECVGISRNLDIDIAVDLKGFTEDARPSIFCARVAPLQISFLGYPGTFGNSEMDYVIADHYVIPTNQSEYYEEKIIRLPNSYQPNRGIHAIPMEGLNRAMYGIPNDSFVFCSFNASQKLTPEIFSSWARILQQVPGSVLWLLIDGHEARANLRNQAARHDLDPVRIIFCGREPLNQHLARLKLADLFLDTFPYNAHTTASDAIRAGLPLLTWSGFSFASRVAGSLLRACDMEELITESLRDYENLAIKIAVNPEFGRRIRRRLESKVPSSPLFDPRRFAMNIEKAYQIVYSRARLGLPPQDLNLE